MTALIGYGSHGKDIETIYYRAQSVGRIGRLLTLLLQPLLQHLATLPNQIQYSIQKSW